MTTSSSIYEVEPCGLCVDPETLVTTVSNHEKRMERAWDRTHQVEENAARLKRLREAANGSHEPVIGGIAEGLEERSSATAAHRTEVLGKMEELVVAVCAEADQIDCNLASDSSICPKLAKIVSIQPALRAIVTGSSEQ